MVGYFRVLWLGGALCFLWVKHGSGAFFIAGRDLMWGGPSRSNWCSSVWIVRAFILRFIQVTFAVQVSVGQAAFVTGVAASKCVTFRHAKGVAKGEAKTVCAHVCVGDFRIFHVRVTKVTW